jgi:hypothetical protein
MQRLWGIASKATEERDGRELGAAVSLAREVVCSDADRKTRSSARHLLETYEPILKNGSARWHDWGAPEWATPPPAAHRAKSLRTQPLGATARNILKTTFFSVDVHSPEEGSPEAADVPWIISVPLGSETETEVEARLLDEENPPEANPPI